MTERDEEKVARRRLEHKVAEVAGILRSTADEMQREAKRNIESAAAPDRDLEFQTYPRVAGRVVSQLHDALFNIRTDVLIETAADAEMARTLKVVKR